MSCSKSVADEVDAPKWFCTVCFVRCPGEHQYKQHLKGKKHAYCLRHKTTLAVSSNSAGSSATSTKAKSSKLNNTVHRSCDNSYSPTSTDLTATLKVLNYFASKMHELQQPCYRQLRKTMAPVVERWIAEKWYGGAAPDLAIVKAKVNQQH